MVIPTGKPFDILPTKVQARLLRLSRSRLSLPHRPDERLALFRPFTRDTSKCPDIIASDHAYGAVASIDLLQLQETREIARAIYVVGKEEVGETDCVRDLCPLTTRLPAAHRWNRCEEKWRVEVAIELTTHVCSICRTDAR